MKYTKDGIEATHEEMVSWLQWRVEMMKAAGMSIEAIRTWGALTSAWLSTGEQYIATSTMTAEEKCDRCDGTGRSKLVLALGSSTTCTACGGTGRKRG